MSLVAWLRPPAAAYARASWPTGSALALGPEGELAALKASEERYRTLVEAIGAIVWATRADGTVEDMVGWREVTGQTPEQVRGFGWLDALHPDDRERTRAAWLRATAAGEPYDVECRVRGVGGRHRWYNARGVPVRGDDGGVREFVGVCIDVDDRKRAEAALQLSQERLVLAQEAGRAGDWDWDLDTGASTWSASLYRLLGLDPERAPPTGETFEGCVHPDDRAKVAAEAQAAIRGERPLDTEFRVVRPDGTIGWLASRGAVVRDEAGRARLLLGVNFDVTERREAADRQRLPLRELSHRVKNTLAMVQGIAASTLAGDRSLAEARDAFASRLRALAGTHDLLTASGWGGARLRALVEAEVRPYGPRAAIRGEELVLSPNAAQTLGLALHELATNAVKHGALSAAEGRVEVVWEILAGAAAPAFHLRWRERGGPPVQAPSRNGFGRRLVEQAVPYELKAQVRLDFAADGLTYELVAPLDAVARKA